MLWSGLVLVLCLLVYLQTMQWGSVLECEFECVSLVFLMQEMQRRWWQGSSTRLLVRVSQLLHAWGFF